MDDTVTKSMWVIDGRQLAIGDVIEVPCLAGQPPIRLEVTGRSAAGWELCPVGDWEFYHEEDDPEGWYVRRTEPEEIGQ